MPNRLSGLRARVVEHPWCAETVREHGEALCPEHLAITVTRKVRTLAAVVGRSRLFTRAPNAHRTDRRRNHENCRCRRNGTDRFPACRHPGAVFGQRPPSWATSGVCAEHAAMLRAEKAMRAALAQETLANVANIFGRKAPPEFSDDIAHWIQARFSARTSTRTSRSS